MKKNTPMPNTEPDTDPVSDTDIVFECPHCQKSLAIDRRGAGRVVNCPDCGQSLTVPIPADTKKAVPLRNTHKAILASVAGLVAVAAIAASFAWGGSSGGMVEVGEIRVIHTSAISKRDAKKVGEYLETSGFSYNREEKTVDLSKPENTIELRIVAEGDGQKITRNMDAQALAQGISDALRKGKVRVDVILCDDDLKPLRTVSRGNNPGRASGGNDTKRTLIGKWETVETTVPRDLAHDTIEFFNDGTWIGEAKNIRGIGAFSENGTWKIDNDGRLILSSPIGVALIYTIVEISRSSLILEGNVAVFGHVRSRYSKK